MSHPRLHQFLLEIFESRSSEITPLIEHADFKDFADVHGLNLAPRDLSKAFIHSSFTHEYGLTSQEQLEFVGDAVLQLIITEELFKRFPDYKEGKLSKLRSAIVNEKSLSLIAKGLELGDLILLGRGEFQKELFLQEAVLADTFEALLAQVYRFNGLEFTKKIYLTWLNKFIPTAFEENYLDDFDAKSTLQEKVLAKYKKLPKYTSVDKGSEFEVTVWINDEAVISGVFASKKKGEKELAKEVLKKDIL